MTAIVTNSTETVIRPNQGVSKYWSEVWRYRELFAFLAWRDIAVRYKQMTLGLAWGVIRPLLTMLILTLIFGRIAQLGSPGDVPYALLVLAALLPWQFFSAVMSEGSTSLIANAQLITKVYFPRLIVPASSVVVAFADLAVAGGLLGVVMLWYGFLPSWQMIFLPAFLLIGLGIALGVSFWLSALTVRYRDFRYIIPFMVQFGLYLTPVAYSAAAVKEKSAALYPLYILNPLVGVIEGFRWCLLGVGEISGWVLPFSIIGSIVLSITGFRYFRASERRFADTI